MVILVPDITRLAVTRAGNKSTTISDHTKYIYKRTHWCVWCLPKGFGTVHFRAQIPGSGNADHWACIPSCVQRAWPVGFGCVSMNIPPVYQLIYIATVTGLRLRLCIGQSYNLLELGIGRKEFWECMGALWTDLCSKWTQKLPGLLNICISVCI